MRKYLVGLAFAAAVAGTGAIVACSDSDSTSPTGGTGTTTTVRITAAAGGTISDPAGKATLNIPAGALEKDTDITLQVEAASNGSVSEVLNFGPDGTKFTKPATLQLKADGITVPEGKSASLAILEGNTWTPIPGSALANGFVTGSVEHFTKFSIIIKDGSLTLVAPDGCADAVTKFKACGGDLKGTWKFDTFCTDTTALAPDPFKGSCPEFKAEVEFNINRTVTIDATTINNSAGTESTDITQTWNVNCVNRTFADGGTAVTSCAEIQSKILANKYTCTGTNEACVCKTSEPKQKEASSQPYSTSGNTLTITEKDGSKTPVEYCVSGDIAYVKAPEKDGKITLLYVLKRQQ